MAMSCDFPGAGARLPRPQQRGVGKCCPLARGRPDLPSLKKSENMGHGSLRYRP